MKGLIRIVFLLVFSVPVFMHAAQITVSKKGDVTSIKTAIAMAAEGDTILIKSGTYKEGNIVVDKPLFLLGIGYPRIDGENETEIITIFADNVRIMGLQVQNVGNSYIEDRAGIRVVESKNVVIEYNILYNTFFGIYLEKSSDCIIRNNLIVGEAELEASSGNAIHAWYGQRILIENNIARNHRDGIYLEFVDNSRIIRNVSKDNLRYGLHFMFSNDDDYFYNEFINNGAGVAVMFSKNIKMNYNLFKENWGAASYGLLLKEIYDGEVSYNKFISNTIGIYGEGANRIKIFKNEFKSNGWALRLSGSSMDNDFTKNNFIANTFNLETKANNVSSNNFNGNYWSDYTGYDLDKDGFGDVPYRPVKLYNYVVNRVPSSLVLMRSLFIDIINFAEKVTPVFTPADLADDTPLMKQVKL